MAIVILQESSSREGADCSPSEGGAVGAVGVVPVENVEGFSVPEGEGVGDGAGLAGKPDGWGLVEMELESWEGGCRTAKVTPAAIATNAVPAKIKIVDLRLIPMHSRWIQ
jgi:hypothetical protein